MCIAGLTLAGIPGLSAFFSKDLILEAGFESGHTVLTLIGIITSLLTAVYSWRLISLAFYGESRRHRLAVHEGPVSMRVPLIVLAACCVLAGWIFVPIHWEAWPTMITSSFLAFLGIWLASHYYVGSPEARLAFDDRFAPLTNFLRNRWFIDAVFEEHIMEGLVLRTAAGAAAADAMLIDRAVDGAAWSSRQAGEGLAWSDSSLIDGIVRLVSAAVRFLSWPSRALQSGFVQSYALLFLAGVLAALGFCLSR